MLKTVQLIVLILTHLFVTTLSQAQVSLLTNNVALGEHTEAFPEGTSVVATEMAASWVTDGEFATDPETVETSRLGGAERMVLFDGNTGSNWKSRTYSAWRKGDWATLNLDFGQPYVLSAFDLWAIHEPTRGTEAMEIFVSEDGVTYAQQGIAGHDGQELAKDLFIRFHHRLDAPVKARYVQLRMQKRRGAKQQQLAEIAVWGAAPEAGVQYLDATSRPAAKCSARNVQSGIVLLDWQESLGMAAGAQAWKVYKSLKPFESTRDEGVELVTRVDGDVSSAQVYPLQPGETYYFGVAAVFPEGENTAVHASSVSMPLPLACETFGDMVAINHFWGGAGNTVSHGENQLAYEVVALDLLEEIGIRQVRWWVVDSEIYKRYFAKGIGIYTYSHGDNIAQATKLGVNAFAGAGNEPDLKTNPIEQYITNLKKIYSKKQSLSPNAVVCAPSSGLEDTSIEWLDRFYEKGGAGHFDVLDLHTYTKIAGGHKVPEGYPRGAPEALYDDMQKVRSVLSKHGQADIPIISTEFGYSEAIADNPSGDITPLNKAQYLVRGLVIHHALGFKRVFLYSFWDDGTDIHFTEHKFGLIDYQLQKKPAYYAVQTLIDQLGHCQMVGPMSGVDEPSFGYVYRGGEDENRISVIWDGTGDRKGVFQTTAATVTIVDLFGKATEIMPSKDGRFSVVYGRSPVYLKADQDIQFVSSSRAKPAAEEGGEVEVVLKNNQLIAAADATHCLIEVNVDNPGREATLDFVAMTEHGKRVGQITHAANTGKSTASIPVSLDFKAPLLAKYTLRVVKHQPDGMGSTLTAYPFYVRQLRAISQAAMTTELPLHGVEEPVFVISNDKLEVIIDARRGGRVLEIIDRASLTNQIHIDYEVLPNLTEIPYAYGIWDSFNGKLKNEPFRVVESASGSLVLAAQAGDFEVTQAWTLHDETLELSLEAHNTSDAAKKFHYKSHPEYTVGGVAESVVDVFYYPTTSGIEKLPYWSGLGEKKMSSLPDNWWAVVDTDSHVAMKQWIIGEDWETPRLWFGQGHYNVELHTVKGFEVPAGQSWRGALRWKVSHVDGEEIESFLDSLE